MPRRLPRLVLRTAGMAPLCTMCEQPAPRALPVASCGLHLCSVAPRGQFRTGLCGRTLRRMCDRILLPDGGGAEKELGVNNPWGPFTLCFNVEATHSVPVACMHEKEPEGVRMRGGLVPSPTKGPNLGPGPPSVHSGAIE